MNAKRYKIVTQYVIEQQNRLYRIAYHYMQEKEAALDMVQNTICKALEKHESLKDTSMAGVWINRILVNECMTSLKKQKREICMEEESLPTVAYVESAYDGKEDLYHQIKQLPHVMQTVIVLYYFQEYTLAEIAKITNTPLSTVKTRLYSALKKLRITLESEERS